MLDKDRIARLRTLPIPAQRMLIDGAWHESQDGRTADVVSPIDGAVLTTTARATTGDAGAAVAAARRAFDDGRWSRTPPAARKKVLTRLAELIERDAPELAVLGVRDNGTEIGMALKAEPLGAAATFRYYAEAIDKIYGEVAPTAPGTLGLVLREAVGVVAAIVPWNMPLMIAAWKLAPALAAGNSVVLKPAEAASLTLLRLGALALEAGLPPGVLNIVTGAGGVVGEALALHADVDVLVFTGSGAVGRQLLRYSAQSNLKRVYLELGGKSPNIVFADAPDLDKAAKAAATAAFRNSGQVCVAGTRLLVEASIHDDFARRVAEATEALKVGDPLDPGNDLGAVISAAQLRGNRDFLDTAQDEGARLLCGGDVILEETGGYYQRPAVVVDVRPDTRLAREEVFGPVLAVLPFADEDEAVRIANGTDFGLAAGVWTANLSRAHRMSGRVRAGMVHVNTYGGSDLTVPLGGHGQSGNGHDKSLHAFDKYLNLKSVWFQF
jgi:gamma-glutamyl-gamma-aminobutyraldehyde dehydrogenase